MGKVDQEVMIERGNEKLIGDLIFNTKTKNNNNNNMNICIKRF